MVRQTPFIIVEDFLKNEGSYTVAVRNFRNHYGLSRHDCVLTRRSVMLWVNNFRVSPEAEPLENFRNCLQQCITFQGRHLEDVIFIE